MEISRELAREYLDRWKRSRAKVGLIFAAHGGTAFASTLTRIATVSPTLAFENDSSHLRFALRKARFEHRPVTVLLAPSRKGLVQLDGLHIWLESGHWLFVCDGKKLGTAWLTAAVMPPEVT